MAKQLLREDGVIFISIDDNEMAQLKLLMDEIFDGSRVLRAEERFKIKHAEKFFEGRVNIHFETQFNGDRMVDLIGGIVGDKK